MSTATPGSKPAGKPGSTPEAMNQADHRRKTSDLPKPNLVTVSATPRTVSRASDKLTSTRPSSKKPDKSPSDKLSQTMSSTQLKREGMSVDGKGGGAIKGSHRRSGSDETGRKLGGTGEFSTEGLASARGASRPFADRPQTAMGPRRPSQASIPPATLARGKSGARLPGVRPQTAGMRPSASELARQRKRVAPLTKEEKEILADVRHITAWLGTVKTGTNLKLFKRQISKMRETILTPGVVINSRKKERQMVGGKPMKLEDISPPKELKIDPTLFKFIDRHEDAIEEGDEDFDSKLQDVSLKSPQPKSRKALPADVVFKDGQWQKIISPKGGSVNGANSDAGSVGSAETEGDDFPPDFDDAGPNAASPIAGPKASPMTKGADKPDDDAFPDEIRLSDDEDEGFGDSKGDDKLSVAVNGGTVTKGMGTITPMGAAANGPNNAVSGLVNGKPVVNVNLNGGNAGSTLNLASGKAGAGGSRPPSPKHAWDSKDGAGSVSGSPSKSGDGTRDMGKSSSTSSLHLSAPLPTQRKGSRAGLPGTGHNRNPSTGSTGSTGSNKGESKAAGHAGEELNEFAVSIDLKARLQQSEALHQAEIGSKLDLGVLQKIGSLDSLGPRMRRDWMLFVANMYSRQLTEAPP